jgi:hypothetical protein
VKRFDAENDIPVKKIDEKAKSAITYLVSGLYSSEPIRLY